MTQPQETPTSHANDVLDHLEHEIEELEHLSRWKVWAGWIVGVLAAAGIVGAFVWYVVSPPSASPSRMSYLPASSTAIELGEPRGGTLSQAPARLSWETVSGRLQYRIRIYERGEGAPLVDRFTTEPSVELTAAERASVSKGKTYVWTVVAQGPNGSTLGAGQSTFRVR